MLELPDGYTLQQAYNDIMFLAHRVKELEGFTDNTWDAVEGEHWVQDALSSYKMSQRLEEVEEKFTGLMANYGSYAMPLLTQLESEKKVDKQGVKYTIK